MAEIIFRNELKPGNLGQIAALHGKIYALEHGFGLGFEAYVMESLLEFYRQYDPKKDRVWVLEDEESMVGFLLLMHRPENQAQLRYFILEIKYRGIGLGRKLISEWMDFYQEMGYSGAYLYTTVGLDPAVHLYEIKHDPKRHTEGCPDNPDSPDSPDSYRGGRGIHAKIPCGL